VSVVRFIAKRVGIGLLILFAVTFVVYVVLAYTIDPLNDLYTYNGPDKMQRIESFTRAMDLDTPPVPRYFKWLLGILGFLWGNGTMGISVQNGQPILNDMSAAIVVTLNLVLASAILAILLGISVGLITAIRQYSTFDYLTTFVSFFLYSLPVFWVAILLKQYGALGFNDFLQNPEIPLPILIILSAVVGVFTVIISSSPFQKRLLYFAVAFAFSFAVLLFCSLTHWFAKPGLSIFGVGLIGILLAIAITYLSFGMDRRQYLTPAIIAVLFIALYYPIQYVFSVATTGLIVGLAAAAIAIGIVIGLISGGENRKVHARNGAFMGLIFFLLLYIDRMMQAFMPYMNHPQIGGRPISTIGSETPNFSGTYWTTTVDSFTHILLPTLTLLLISFAGYTRYTRASVLDVLNADYIRTARAKGLPERSVIMRHAFKNAIIPLATIIPLDIASVIGGAIITESIFGWTGMGSFFINSLNHSDFNGVMAVLLVTSSLAILANIVSDLLYVALDPRIRLEN
jgi:peptide/nickel transport system permease protein